MCKTSRRKSDRTGFIVLLFVFCFVSFEACEAGADQRMTEKMLGQQGAGRTEVAEADGGNDAMGATVGCSSLHSSHSPSRSNDPPFSASWDITEGNDVMSHPLGFSIFLSTHVTLGLGYFPITA